MPDPDETQIREVAKEVIQEVIRDGKGSEWTPRMIRREVEKRMQLEEGTLDSQELRKIVKDTTDAALVEEDGEVEEATPKDRKRPKKRAANEDGDKPAPKKARTSRAKKAIANPAAKKSNKLPRSSSVVPSSDEDDSKTPASKDKPKSVNSSDKHEKSAEDHDDDSSAKPPKKRQRKPVDNVQHPKSIETPAVKAKDDPLSMNEAGNQSRTSVDAIVPEKNAEGIPQAGSKAPEEKSESEMSVLIDEPPKRKRKTKGDNEESKPKSKELKEKRKKVSKELSKDEETIKRLKSLVVACGVRKVWAKEFKDLETPSEQIRRLRQILGDLGMTGRMSLEQARAIKEKRDLAQELEDVQQFEQAVVAGPSGRRTRKGMTKSQDVSTSNDESEDDYDAAPKRQRNAARQSIMAFLGDQSDDD